MYEYESPIKLIMDRMAAEIAERTDQNIWQAIQRVGFDVDKAELIRALKYDRGQYEKGYADAMKTAVPLDKLCEWLSEHSVIIPCETCRNFSNDYCTAIGDMDKPCPNKAEDWQRAIKEWMEGLDAAD